MTNETIYNYEIADHWLSPLINGDYTGLEDGEETTLRDFLGGLPKHFHYKSPLVGIWDVLDEEGSFAVDEVSGLHANCFKCSLTFI
jgi:hypothetical protein